MTVGEAIGMINGLCPNTIEEEIKIMWLRHLDEQIQDEVIDTHEIPEGYQKPDFENYDITTPLIVEDIHSELYFAFLRMKIAMVHADKEEYEINATNFNNMYITYQQYYNRKYRPKRKGYPIYR